MYPQPLEEGNVDLLLGPPGSYDVHNSSRVGVRVYRHRNSAHRNDNGASELHYPKRYCHLRYPRQILLKKDVTGEIKNRLRVYRPANNMTQEELAKRTRVTRQTIISIEEGRYDLSLELFFKPAKIFKSTIEDIFIYQDEKPNQISDLE